MHAFCVLFMEIFKKIVETKDHRNRKRSFLKHFIHIQAMSTHSECTWSLQSCVTDLPPCVLQRHRIAALCFKHDLAY